jgi:ABC-2 type transport system ATP-binding protein
VSIAVEDGATRLIEPVRTLDALGLPVDDIGLRRPTLDEVFLTPTGKAIDPGRPTTDDRAT